MQFSSPVTAVKIRHLLLPLLLLGCAVEELPVDPAAAVGALDTGTRSEPDQTWQDRLTARDIRWRFISAAPLRRSISVVGSYQLTFVNADPDRAWQSQIAVRFRGGDGALHVPATPLGRLVVAADSSVVLRDNFVLEVADAQAANAITRMNIVLF